MKYDAYEAVLAKLGQVRRRGDTAVGCCPAHEDKNPSLSVTRGVDGRVLIHCHAGCAFDAIVDALGMRKADFAPSGGGAEATGKDGMIWESVEAACEHLHCRFGGKLTRHDYLGGDRTLLGAVVRFDYTGGREKVVRPLSPVRGGWRIRAMPAPRPLYNLPQLLATPLDTVIYVVEGEKCVNALKAIGLVAVTSSGGSNAARKTCWKALAGRPVVVLPDNDESGRTYRDDVIELVNEVGAASVSVPELPGLGEHGDVADWIDLMRGAGYETAGIAERLSLLENAHGTADGRSGAADDPDELRAGPVLRCFADIEPTEVRWLWPNWIPLGRCTVMTGAPGGGKSMLTIEIAACVTTGRAFPDGSRCEPGSVILVSAEDDAADTIRPRLDAAGADVRRVQHMTSIRVAKRDKVSERVFTLADLAELEECLKRFPNCRVVVIDPIGSHLGNADSYRDTEVRSVLAPLTLLAQRYSVAILLVAHDRKGAMGNADESTLGSRAFVGLPRSSIHVLRDPANRDRRLMLAGKRNVAAEGPGFAFRITGAPCKVSWETERVTVTADEVMAAIRRQQQGTPGPNPERREEAEEWLRRILAGGPMPVATIKKEAKDAGLAWRTVQRAADVFGVKRKKGSFAEGWGWGLPPPGT